MSISDIVKTKYVTSITVQDPDTGEDVELEVHKDPESGGIFAIDASFLDQVTDTLPSLFNEFTRLVLDKPQETQL